MAFFLKNHICAGTGMIPVDRHAGIRKQEGGKMIVFPQAVTERTAAPLLSHHMEYIHAVLESELLAIGVDTAFLSDAAGNVLLKCGNGRFKDVLSPLAALVAANFSAVKGMASVIGEKKFSLFFHQGEKESIYYSEIHEDLLLAVVYSNRVALGDIRLHIEKTVNTISEIIA